MEEDRKILLYYEDSNGKYSIEPNPDIDIYKHIEFMVNFLRAITFDDNVIAIGFSDWANAHKEGNDE